MPPTRKLIGSSARSPLGPEFPASWLSTPPPSTQAASSISPAPAELIFASFEDFEGFAISSSEDETKGKRVTDSQAAILERRRRQRDLKRKSRERRKNDVDSMKEEVRQLEAKYEQLYIAKMAKPAPAAAQDTASDLSIQVKYTQAREELQALRTQIAQMKKRISDFDHFSSVVEIMALACMRDFQKSNEFDRCLTASSPSADMLGLQTSRIAFLRPMTSAECINLNVSAYREIAAILRNGEETAGTSLHGWQEYRARDNGRLRFSSRKLFHARSALELSVNTWEVLSTPAKFRLLFSSSLTMQVDLVQQVDNDNVVLYRTVRIPNSTRMTKTMFLVSRFHTEYGYMVVSHSFDRAPYLPISSTSVSSHDGDGAHKDDKDSQWMEIFTWTILSEKGEACEHCQIDIGGFVMNMTPEAFELWRLEVLLSSLRLEAQVVGPVFKVN